MPVLNRAMSHSLKARHPFLTCRPVRGAEHFCLGSTFARRELRTILPKLFAAAGTLELDGEPEWAQTNFVGGVKHLPVAATSR